MTEYEWIILKLFEKPVFLKSIGILMYLRYNIYEITCVK